MEKNIVTSKDNVKNIFNSISSIIGIHVLLIVLEHALWKTKSKYQDASKIHISEEGINMDELDSLPVEKTQLILNEFIMSIISALSRLVGNHIAQKFTEELQKEVKEVE